MIKDSLVKSLIKGRLGAAVLMGLVMVLQGAGYEVESADLQSALDIIPSLLAGVAALMATYSKVKESKK